jgi:hypothetical protein
VATLGPHFAGAADRLYRDADAGLYVAKSGRDDVPLDEALLS